MVHHPTHSIGRLARLLLWATALLGLWCALDRPPLDARAQPAAAGVPRFRVDPTWPKPLPNNWVLGQPASVAVDAHDHVWLLHRPLTAAASQLAAGKTVAPPVLEFDQEGNVARAWGGPAADHAWPAENTTDYPRGGPAEHGIYVDHKDNVWVTGNGDIVLKFTRTGRFLMQIGEFFKSGGSNDTRLLGSPTDVVVDPLTNELFVADGYLNRRVIVFDADSGKYKRHWGAYGRKPDDGPAVNYEPDKPPPEQFFVVHCIRQSRDGLIYVCDRHRNRLQVFQRNGTFVKETIVAKDTPTGAGIVLKGPLSAGITRAGIGSVFRVAFSADASQEYLYVADSSNARIWTLRRSNLELLGSLEARGLHHMAGSDSKGNVYASGTTLPVKFRFEGFASPAAAR